MEDLFKRVLYTGAGVISNTTEKIQKLIDELVEQGKITQTEGKKVVTKFEKSIETQKDEFETRLQKLVSNTLEKFNLPRFSDVEKLEKRVKSLEVKLGLLNKELEEKEEKKAPKAKSEEDDDKEMKKTPKAKKGNSR